MGKLLGPPIDQHTKNWVEKQHIFFVASAPLSAENRVNMSPKSASEFRVLGERHIGYMDKTGSGGETAAHIMENGRLTIMFVALNGAPKIVRFHGKGRVLSPEEFLQDKPLMDAFGIESKGDWETKVIGGRSVILMEVERVTGSCGWSIPIYQYVKERKTLDENNAKDDVVAFQNKWNSFSIDGLKGIAQKLREETPSSYQLENGYIFAQYDHPPSLLHKLLTHFRMLYASGLHEKHKQLASFVLGMIACQFLSLIITKRRK